ncbi:sensor histidine kinase [Amycolatopsis anabasis]|uniref:sensor histidine kinase n=1 Tax=Amycolatopsis anabasis TaxID=1840409 RepID=UPI00131E56FC|nr:histidine kinase [Amycolatopsis anabasis]
MKPPAPVVDAALVGIALLDVWLNADPSEPWFTVAATVAAAALAVRRRLPYVAFVLSLPALFLADAVIAALIALYTVAKQTRDRRILAGCAVAVVAGYTLPWPPPELLVSDGNAILLEVIYAIMTAAAPISLGQLMRTRRDLSLRLDEIREAREHERRLDAASALARERTQLAREMHDVVSHQVSLIAVRAGALQVSTADPDARDAAATIRQLSVNTLDELRHMVTLLRASGSPSPDLTPQPTLAELDQLIRTSGIKARLDGELPADTGAPVQRAIYRTVQEALTNVRKHAPGATATIRLGEEDNELVVTITNTPPTRPIVPLPSARQGLLGLRERAALLGGTVEAGPTRNRGYRVRLRLPASPP